MKNITIDEVKQAQELFNNIQDNIKDLTRFLKSKMSRIEREQFRYHCLGYLEPALMIDHVWILDQSSSVKSLEKWLKDATDSAELTTKNKSSKK